MKLSFVEAIVEQSVELLNIATLDVVALVFDEAGADETRGKSTVSEATVEARTYDLLCHFFQCVMVLT